MPGPSAAEFDLDFIFDRGHRWRCCCRNRCGWCRRYRFRVRNVRLHIGCRRRRWSRRRRRFAAFILGVGYRIGGALLRLRLWRLRLLDGCGCRWGRRRR